MGDNMIDKLIRALLLLWAAFFALTGLQGLFGAEPYSALFGISGDATGINTVRADLSAFFLVAAGGAALGAWRPTTAQALWVPIALFGCALVGRAIGLALGDPLTSQITQAMVAEAVSVALLFLALRRLTPA